MPQTVSVPYVHHMTILQKTLDIDGSLFDFCRKSDTISATMNKDLRKLVLQRIEDEGLKAFSCYDFTDLASYKTISKCLERLEDSATIRRIIQGIYSLNAFDDVLKLPIMPSVNDVVNCLARKHRWIICPTGNLALNVMGLSSQVPALYSYLSTGPYRDYMIYGMPVLLKRTMARELIDYSHKTQLLIQCIKTIGKDNITEEEVATLKNKLSDIDKKKALEETTVIQAWIRKIIVLICEEKSDEKNH